MVHRGIEGVAQQFMVWKEEQSAVYGIGWTGPHPLHIPVNRRTDMTENIIFPRIT